MSRAHSLAAAIALSTFTVAAQGQSVESRIAQHDGLVEVTYPSRPTACGNGRQGIMNIFGYGGSQSDRQRWGEVCLHGPARVLVDVDGGQVVRLRATVGPTSSAPSDARHIDISASDAITWLSAIARTGNGRAASDAIVPIILADVPDASPILLSLARDENRPRNVRQSSITWLASLVTYRLGLENAQEESDDDEMRAQAVFALSREPKNESVPELIDIARTSKHPSARRAAIFWLGQTGDTRAVSVYEDLLKR